MKHASAPESSRDGFVIFFVLIMLFAILITAVTGYMVVSSEFSMSNHAKEGAEVISIAHGGMQQFLASQTGAVGDSKVYAIGLGDAIVTRRKLMEKDSLNHLYYLRSEGTLADVRTPGAPVARSVVGAFAWHRLNPMAHRGAVIIAVDEIDTGDDDDEGGVIDGRDQSLSTQCSGGGTAGITGAIAKDQILGEAVDGNPDEEVLEWVLTDMADSLGLRWDVLENPSFPFEFDNIQPIWTSVPLDSFPLVRWQGNGPPSGWSGRGVLVITGEFDPAANFAWDGIVLTGSTDHLGVGLINGILVGGLDGPNPESKINFDMEIRYNACYVYGADRALSYLELVDNTIFEAY